MAEKRKDSKNRVLKDGEYERADGRYEYRWKVGNGKTRSIYTKSLAELRKQEGELAKRKNDGIRTDAWNVTVNDMYDLWVKLKRGLKGNTFSNYEYMYKMYVRDDLGKMKLEQLKRSDVRAFYNRLADNYNLSASTIDNVHSVLHQVLELAVEDEYLRTNVSDNALKELKRSRNFGESHRKALTGEEQKLLIDFLTRSEQYNHWLPVITVMLEGGLRVGEATGLTWDDVDLENGYIDVNHTLVYYNHRVGGPQGCYFSINSPKTAAGRRLVPMTSAVKEAFIQERNYQKEHNIRCTETIDGYTDFVFVNRLGNVEHQGAINRAIRRIIRDCNQEVFDKVESHRLSKKDLVLLPKFSCHSLRHTCATRMCESGVNVKVIQDFLGHSDISTTMNIYTDVTKEFKTTEIGKYDEFLMAWKARTDE